MSGEFSVSKIAKAVLPYLLIISIAVFMMHDIFQSGIMTKSDNPVHMVEASFLANTAFPKYHWINGWYQNESGGMPLQLYFYQFSYWIILFVYFIFHIPMELAYKLVLVFAYAFPALALYLLLSKKFGRIVAFFPSLFYLFQLDNTKMFLAGMWNNGIGLGFLVLLIYLLEKCRKKITVPAAFAAGLTFGAIVLSHYFVAMAATALIVAYFIFDSRKITEKLFFYGWVTIFAAAMTLFYTYPFIETSKWLVFNIGWGLGRNLSAVLYALFGIFFSVKPLLPAVQQAVAANYLIAAKEFFAGVVHNLPMFAVDALALLGLAYFAGQKEHKERDFLKIIMVFTFALLILGSGFWFLIPSLSKAPFLSSILAYRFLYYGRVGLIIFAAFAISQIWRRAELPATLAWLKAVFRHKNKLAAIFVVLFITLLLSSAFFPPKDFTETANEFALTDETIGVVAWLSEKNAGPAVHTLFQGFFGNIKDSALPVYYLYQHNISSFGAWAATQAPVQSMTTTEEGRMFGKFVRDISSEEIFEKSKAYNIKYLVVVESNLKNKLAGSDFFESVKKFEHFEIFAVKNFVSEVVESNRELQYQITKFDDHEIVMQILNVYENNEVSIKVSYHPYWHAFVNGKELLGLRANSFGIMKIALPAGNYELRLAYVPTKLVWQTIVMTIVISVLALLILPLNARRKKTEQI